MEEPPAFPYVGGLLLVVSVVLFIGAAAFFDAGQPGAPRFPDRAPGYGIGSGVTVFLPRTAPITWSHLFATYRQGDDGGWEQQLVLNVTTERPEPFSVVVELRGAARIQSPHRDRDIAESVELGDRQLVLLRFGARRHDSVRFDGRLRTTPAATENARTAFVSPAAGLRLECDALTETGRGLARMTFATWAAMTSPCQSPDYTSETEMVLVTGDTPARVDYLDASPIESGGSPGFKWLTKDTTASLLVRLSYVDVNGEAIVQRNLFLSGVLIGLASACAPYPVQSLTGYALKRWRRRRGAWGL